MLFLEFLIILLCYKLQYFTWEKLKICLYLIINTYYSHLGQKTYSGGDSHVEKTLEHYKTLETSGGLKQEE